MARTEITATDAMKALRAKIESRLMDNPDYRALVALDRAIAEVSNPDWHSASREVVPGGGKPLKRDGGEPSQKPLTQPEATARLLNEHGPMPTSAILERIGDLGVTVSGADPVINLSSSISKSGQFKSVRINGVSHWWFKDRELPNVRTAFEPAMDFGGQTDAFAPAADEHNQEGDDDDAAA